MKKRSLAFLILMVILIPFMVEGTKVKNSFKIEKEQKKGKNIEDGIPEGREVILSDTVVLTPEDSLIYHKLETVSFAGYDKEANSVKESFILVNSSDHLISGFEVRIDYLDMQGRMLHSRIIKEKCFVPPGETRRLDIKSWDVQHTYYYYLGNEPKRVATPFQVSFKPQRYWIIE